MSSLTDHADMVFLMLFTAGVYLFIREDMHAEISRLRLRRNLKQRTMNMRRTGSLEGHILRLMAASGKKNRNPGDFIRMSVLWAVISGLAAAFVCGPFAGLAAVVTAGGLPYIFLRAACERKRNAIANESERLVSTILSSYRISCGNMEEALEYTAAQNEDLPHTARLIGGLLLRLRESSTEEGMRMALEELSAVTGSAWTKVLGVNIRLACARGTDVSRALEDLLGQIRESKLLMQERMRDNSEGGRMTTIMIPAAMAVTLCLAKSQTGLSFAELAGSQFGDPTAAAMFMLIILLFLFNLAAGRFIRNLNMYTG